MRIKDISEKEWIEIARKYVDKSILSIDDDAFAMKVDSEAFLISNVDGFVESSDKPEKMPWHACGYKATIAALSDIVAKGAHPKQVIVSIGLPPDFGVNESMEILQGIKEACDTYSVKFYGGDLNRTKEMMLDVVAIGISKSMPIPRHSEDCNANDRIYWMGPPFGSSAKGYRILTGQEEGEIDLVKRYFNYPKLQIDFLKISGKYNIKSSMDCSDGLALTLCSLVEGSGYGIELDKKAILGNTIHGLGSEWQESVFFGGEEYGILFIAEEEVKGALLIGRLKKERGIWLENKEIECRGWDHFA